MQAFKATFKSDQAELPIERTTNQGIIVLQFTIGKIEKPNGSISSNCTRVPSRKSSEFSLFILV